MSQAASTNDTELLIQWRSGDRIAGDLLVTRYLGEISRFFRNKVCRPEDAADLVNQTFLACTSSRHHLRENASFRAFLYAIAHNVLCGYIRKKNKQAAEAVDFLTVCVATVEVSSPSSIVMKNRETQALVDALRHLPLADQIVLEHRYFSGLDATQIGELLEVPAATVRGRLLRARDRLRTKVQDILSNRVDGGKKTVEVREEDLEQWALQVRALLS